ncbi:MAG: UvrD-helicase domain-containing protein [Vigna little leaf phytoplasma]|nr:UvrD-helicase domain-containing protein [Vigna little leaf phytoplasma]
MKLEYLKQLNQEQLEIVNSTAKNSIYVIAGAGTGKTRTLTHRIAFLIKYLNIPSEKILAVTFTNNAAQEMKQRIKEMCGDHSFFNLTVTTFHALGYKILKNYIKYLDFDLNSNLTSDFSIIDESESKKIIKKCIKDLGLDKNHYLANDVQKNIFLTKIGMIKQKILSEIEQNCQYEEYEEWFVNNYRTVKFKSPEYQIIYQNYEYYLRRNNLIDFDNLIIYSYQLLSNYQEVAEFYQKKFNYVLIDEFQDIDLIQYQIIKLISQKKQVLAVGDPNQNIYSFRGADILCSNLFLQDFKASIKHLTQNYRSTNNILAKANLLINFNYCKKDNDFRNFLKSNLDNGPDVIYQHFENSEQEAQFILENIKALLSNNYQYKDIAILYRLNHLNRDIENLLITANIPYRIQGYVSLYKKKEIKDIIAYLQILMNPQKDFYLKRIINIPSRNIGNKTVAVLEQIAEQKKITLFEAIEFVSKSDCVNKHLQKKIKSFYNIFQKLKEIFDNAEICNLSNVIFLIDETINYSRKLNLIQNVKLDINHDINANLQQLQNILSSIDKISEGNFKEKIISFLEKITLFNEETNDIQINNHIILSSIHKAKGLEFKVVFTIGWEESVFNADKENDFINDNVQSFEEERRLAYVAITRAKELLYISSAKERIILGKLCISKPISFIKEMKLNKKSNYYRYRNKYCLKMPKSSPKSIFDFYRIGSKLKHDIFGTGTVISFDEKQKIVVIVFEPPHGIKKFTTATSALSKINPK